MLDLADSLPVRPTLHFASYLTGMETGENRLCGLQVRPHDGRTGFDCAHAGPCTFKGSERPFCTLGRTKPETIQK